MSPGSERPIATCSVRASSGTRMVDAEAPGLASVATGTSATASPASRATRAARVAGTLNRYACARVGSPARTSIFFNPVDARYQPPCVLSLSQNAWPGFMYVRANGFA